MNAATLPAFAVTRQGPLCLVTMLARVLDQSNADSIGVSLLELVNTPEQNALHLDFANVDYLSSMALGKLVTLHQRAAAAGMRLRLLNVLPLPYEVFCVTNLVKLLDVQALEADQSCSETDTNALAASRSLREERA